MTAHTSAPGTPPTPKRCAVYARTAVAGRPKNAPSALDAQREACEAYVHDRAADGWRLNPERYEDEDYSGAALERPALGRLLADVEAGKLDVIVVHRVDRLIRSPPAFARLMRRFERASVAVVSVTEGPLRFDVVRRLAQAMAEVEGVLERERVRGRPRARRKPSPSPEPTPGGPLATATAARAIAPDEQG